MLPIARPTWKAADNTARSEPPLCPLCRHPGEFAAMPSFGSVFQQRSVAGYSGISHVRLPFRL